MIEMPETERKMALRILKARTEVARLAYPRPYRSDGGPWCLIRRDVPYPHAAISFTHWAQRGTHDKGGPIWVNQLGGYCPDRYVAVLRTIEGDLPAEETHEVRELIDIDPATKTGWLSPGGAIHRCEMFRHDDYAHVILGQEVSDLEREGWCRLTSRGPRFGRGHEPTEDQAKTLMSRLWQDPYQPREAP